jgi:hypothetical protein
VDVSSKQRRNSLFEGYRMSKEMVRAMISVTQKMNKIPFEFVLETLSRVHPRIQPMFGCQGIYVGEKIVLALRRGKNFEEDNGVWIATVREQHASLKKEFPSLRSIGLFGGAVTGWQNLPSDADDFEQSAIRICELILKGDPRIGKVPKTRYRKK